MWSSVQRLWTRTDGAVAPTIALSLFGLIASAGVAFDYARLAAMDTELQQAADQAALAAATQLDRSDDSQTHATAAIQDADNAKRLAVNLTRFSNDEAGAGVEIDAIEFCSAFDDAVQDTDAACEETDEPNESRFVVVKTSLRTANYAFTPIVRAFAGTSHAEAVAGVESSICNVAPLLVCVGDEPDFPTEEDIGRGLYLKTAGGDAWVAGNYGLLDFGNGKPAVEAALLGHGLNGCQSTDDNQTETGNADITDAINTRMDVYGGGGSTKDASVCDVSDGTGCPAKNTRKDMTLTMTYTKSTARTVTVAPADDLNCGASGGTVSYADDFVYAAGSKGFPRDTCHSSSCEGGNFGDGVWDYAGYMAANHPGVATDSVPAEGDSPTRYEVYTWELAHQNDTPGAMDAQKVGATEVTSKNGPQQTTIWTYKKQCNFAKPKLASTAYPEQKDRRILPIVAADCSNLKGKGEAFEDYTILRVFDIFLTEPSLPRTAPQEAHEIYGEVLGPAQTFEAGNGFQYYSRNRPYLIR